MSLQYANARFDDLRIFVVDDDEAIGWAIETELKALGAEVRRATTLKQALEKFPSFDADIAISDINLPDGNGLELLKKWHKEIPTLPIIMITAHGAVESAVTALRNDAFDYLQKPFDTRDLIIALKRAAEVTKLRRRVSQLEGRESTREPLNIIGDSPAMQRLKRKLEKIAKSKTDTVLIIGESGSGKELAARAVHDWSDTPNEPFVEINCASIPETLLESELFGYEKGAFTDAKERKIGLFEIAGQGSVFLDEIGEMPPKLQAKLLRILEYRRFKRLGGTKDIQFSGRIIAATNRRLEEEITQGGFRQDLYYRINAISVFVPPLRDRTSDIPILVDFLLGRLSYQLKIPKPAIAPSALNALAQHPWKGNVRELKNILQRSLVFYEPKEIHVEDLDLPDVTPDPQPATKASIVTDSAPTPATETHIKANSQGHTFVLPQKGVELENVEKSLVIQALERSRFNQSKACLLLGISRHALRYRLEKFGLIEETES